MKYRSVYDIIGPVMIGPSSSHTAGAVRIGQVARKIFGREPQKIEIHFYGSFAETYKGHATDVAVIGGILDFETDDVRIRDAISIAKEKGIDVTFFKEDITPTHPNTMRIYMEDSKEKLHLKGVSVGGGAIQINEVDGFPLKLSGESPAVLIFHKDAYGTIAKAANLFAEYKMNISYMEVSRLQKGQEALMVIETDQSISDELIADVSTRDNISKVIVVDV